jgi:hypothetical protein
MNKLDKLSKAEPVAWMGEYNIDDIREHRTVVVRERTGFAETPERLRHLFTTDPRPLVALLQQLEGALEGFIENDDTPEASCSCHIAPPCGDCVEYAQQRELLSNATEALAAIAAFEKED